MFTTNDIFESALTAFSGVTRNSFASPNNIIADAVRKVRTEVFFPESKRVAPLLPAVYAGDHMYQVPPDLDRPIDIIPYQGRSAMFESTSTVTSGQIDYLMGMGAITTDFLHTSPDAISFDTNRTSQLYTTEYRMGTKFMRISQPVYQTTPILIHDCDSVSENGTVTAGGDASNLDVNKVFFMNGLASLDFDITQNTGVSTITFDGISPIDIEEITRDGATYIGLYVPSALQGNLTSIAIRIGNDSSNYLEMTATKNDYDGEFIQGFNGVRFERRTATEEGTINEGEIEYVQIRLTHTASAVGVKIDSIFAAKGIGYGLYYYSDYYYIDATTGAFKSKPTSAGLDDQVIFDNDSLNLVIEQCKMIMDQGLRGETSGNIYQTSHRALYGTQGHANDDGLYAKYRRDHLTEKGVVVTGY